MTPEEGLAAEKEVASWSRLEKIWARNSVPGCRDHIVLNMAEKSKRSRKKAENERC